MCSAYLPSQITQNDWRDMPFLYVNHVASPLTDNVCICDKYLTVYHRGYQLAMYEVRL